MNEFLDDNWKQIKLLDDNWKQIKLSDENFDWLNVWMKVIPKQL